MDFKRVKGFYGIGAKTFMAGLVSTVVILVMLVIYQVQGGGDRPMVAFVLIVVSVTVLFILSGWQTWIGVRAAQKVH